MARLPHDEFEARYGDIARRLFDFDQPAYVSGVRPNLIFRRPLDWPVIPLPGVADTCRHVDEARELKHWLRYNRDNLFYDEVLPELHFWLYWLEVRRLLWAPMIEVVAGHGPGRAALFEPKGRWIGGCGGEAQEYWSSFAEIRAEIAAAGFETADRPPDSWELEDWRAAEDRIDGGLPLDFGNWLIDLGDHVCLCDETAAWAIHSWGMAQISYLTAEPALMDRVLEAVGGPETVGKFFSFEYSVNAEFEDAPESFLDFFRTPPFVEMPLRTVPWLGDHLKAHPWLDKAFADL
ncbi:MAG: hypothetical protein F4114_09185 [Rhodospirillaceae bacterium]|nr:hypothetical protein [Rhodospirillaceae bacterium]MYB14826.1 hypothetical protein [Rhodospirillaceae bacterium]MYI49246.1 hypothetical protein [Rhodospirillaceae bacterium]